MIEHPGVDEVHITGAERTHDAIVWGTGDEAVQRRARGEPRVQKPITSELGNVSPVVVVPGVWSRRQLRHQAEHVATQVLHNAGHNCNAAEVLVLPEGWPQRGDFMEALSEAIASRPARHAYYPGSGERFDRIVASGATVRLFGDRQLDSVPPAIVEGIDSATDSPAFGQEAFCHVLATTLIGGDDPGEYLERAVDFCNDRLRGTLNATIVVDPDTEKSLGGKVGRSVATLRYGCVGINVWAAAGFPLGVVPWGAYPGHQLDDIQSGRGFVHNARLVDRPEKSVIRAPFHQIPKPPWSLFHRRGGKALRAAAMFEAHPGAARLVRLLGPAMRP
jgi:aldehyde dehydrogenase (NAD(P)+)